MFQSRRTGRKVGEFLASTKHTSSSSKLKINPLHLLDYHHSSCDLMGLSREMFTESEPSIYCEILFKRGEVLFTSGLGFCIAFSGAFKVIIRLLFIVSITLGRVDDDEI